MCLLNITELKEAIREQHSYLLFCFGTSLVSQIISVKTRKNKTEIVPTHVALIIDGEYIYESTSQPDTLKNKTIPAGVRRYLLEDFYSLEKNKNTKYYLYDVTNNFDPDALERYIHYPYGKDTILDFVLRDGSDGVSKGLICSQYANKVTNILNKACPNPAELYRKIKKMENESWRFYYE